MEPLIVSPNAAYRILLQPPDERPKLELCSREMKPTSIHLPSDLRRQPPRRSDQSPPRHCGEAESPPAKTCDGRHTLVAPECLTRVSERSDMDPKSAKMGVFSGCFANQRSAVRSQPAHVCKRKPDEWPNHHGTGGASANDAG